VKKNPPSLRAIGWAFGAAIKKVRLKYIQQKNRLLKRTRLVGTNLIASIPLIKSYFWRRWPWRRDFFPTWSLSLG